MPKKTYNVTTLVTIDSPIDVDDEQLKRIAESAVTRRYEAERFIRKTVEDREE